MTPNGIVTLASFTCQWRDALMGRTLACRVREWRPPLRLLHACGSDALAVRPARLPVGVASVISMHVVLRALLLAILAIISTPARAADDGYWGRKLANQPTNFIFGYGSLINSQSHQAGLGHRGRRLMEARILTMCRSPSSDPASLRRAVRLARRDALFEEERSGARAVEEPRLVCGDLPSGAGELIHPGEVAGAVDKAQLRHHVEINLATVPGEGFAAVSTLVHIRQRRKRRTFFAGDFPSRRLCAADGRS